MVHFHLIQSEVVWVTVTQEQRDYDSDRSGWGDWEPELLHLHSLNKSRLHLTLYQPTLKNPLQHSQLQYSYT